MHTEVWYYFVIPQVASQSHLEKRTEVTEPVLVPQVGGDLIITATGRMEM